MAGKIAIVTGASRGIGRAICTGLARHGVKVVAASRTENDTEFDTEAATETGNSAGAKFAKYASGSISDTVSGIKEAGGTAIAVRCDVSNSHDLESLVAEALETFGRIDILVSNAGIDCESPVANLDVDLLDRCLAVNVRAPILLCRFALPAMISQGWGGSIFGITSGSALTYREDRVGYSMSKAALERTLLSLAREVEPHGIAVNALSPGRVDTWMNRNGDWPGTGHIPMEQPESIIPAAVWLASQSAATFTGHRVERAEFGTTWGAGVAKAIQ